MREQVDELEASTSICSSTPKKITFDLLLKDNKIVTLDQPAVMGVINCSPNSFFSPFDEAERAVDAAVTMVAQGATFIDIGGEATNPKVNIAVEKPSIAEEICRVVPVIEAVRKQCLQVLISVDSSRAEVMRAAVAAGADIVNDQRMLREEGALQAIVDLQVPVCLMHGFAEARHDIDTASPAQVLGRVEQDLQQAVTRCLQTGIDRQRIILDPGFGQGNKKKGLAENYYIKSCAENYYLLAHLNELAEMGYPLLVGWSRKSMIADVLGGAPVSERLYGSLAAAAVAALNGAAIIRVHDVAETMDVVKIIRAVKDHD